MNVDQSSPLAGSKKPDGVIRIGVGAGFAGDRLDPAVELVTLGELDVAVFEVLAERTIALAQRRRRVRSGPAYDLRLAERLLSVLPEAIRQGTTLITNGGAADPRGAGLAVRDVARDLGLAGCRIAVVTGDDVTQRIDLERCVALESGEPLSVYKDRLVSANAYLGIAPLVEALSAQPRVVVAGRTTDIALFLAPIAHRFGWKSRDWQRLANGSIVGHLLECAGQLTGGYFADGGRKRVPNLARLGFPFADVSADGSAVLRKLPMSGGRLDRQTCTEQLLYEVENPALYLTPDVSIDFRSVDLSEVGADAVRVSGAIGQPPPDLLKVSLGVDGGFVGIGEISFAGPGCLARAQLAAEIVEERWAEVYHRDAGTLHVSFLGLTSCTPWLGRRVQVDAEPPETRLRVAVRDFDRNVAVDLAREIESLYTNGPAGGGGVEVSVQDSVNLISTLIPRDLVEPKVEVLT